MTREVDELRDRLAATGRVEIGFDRRRPVLLVVGSAGFAAIGAWMVASGDGIGWLVVVTFGACVLAGLRQLATSGDVVVVDERGVTYERWGLEVAWSDLGGAFGGATRGRHFVQVALTPAYFQQFRASRPPHRRWTLQVARTDDDAPVIVLPSPLAVDSTVLAAFLAAEVDARRPDAAGEPGVRPD